MTMRKRTRKQTVDYSDLDTFQHEPHIKPRGNGCSGRLNGSCSNSGTCRVSGVRNMVMNHERDQKAEIAVPTSGYKKVNRRKIKNGQSRDTDNIGHQTQNENKQTENHNTEK